MLATRPPDKPDLLIRLYPNYNKNPISSNDPKVEEQQNVVLQGNKPNEKQHNITFDNNNKKRRRFKMRTDIITRKVPSE